MTPALRCGVTHNIMKQTSCALRLKNVSVCLYKRVSEREESHTRCGKSHGTIERRRAVHRGPPIVEVVRNKATASQDVTSEQVVVCSVQCSTGSL